MSEELNKLIEVLNSIVNRLENKPDRTYEENLMLVDVKTRLDVARTLAPSFINKRR